MALSWTKFGSLYTREYHAAGNRGRYVIDLDQPPIDRWVLYVDGERSVEDIYYIDQQDNAKRIAEEYEQSGVLNLPNWRYFRPDGRSPRIVPLLQPGSISEPADRVAGVPHLTNSVHSVPVREAHENSPVKRTTSSLVEALVSSVRERGLRPFEGSVEEWLPWKSGVYALVDCVFSAQAKYETTVLPMLNQRLSRRLPDSPKLSFSDFIADVNSFGPDRFESYAAEVLTRQRLSGRLKVEVCCEAAQFFVSRGLERMSDLRNLGDGLEPLICQDLRYQVRGIEPALAQYLLIVLGDEQTIKLDTRLRQFLAREIGWDPDPYDPGQYAFAVDVFKEAARDLDTTASRLENAIWRFESNSTR